MVVFCAVCMVGACSSPDKQPGEACGPNDRCVAGYTCDPKGMSCQRIGSVGADAGVDAGTDAIDGGGAPDAAIADAATGHADAPVADAAGGCSIVGTWEYGSGVNYFILTLNVGGTTVWQVHNAVGLNTGTGTYSWSTGTVTIDNTAVTMMQDPNFVPCLDIVGTYSVAFAADCNSFTLNRVSDTCPVRPSSGILFRQ
jgi:hypothetical protein